MTSPREWPHRRGAGVAAILHFLKSINLEEHLPVVVDGHPPVWRESASQWIACLLFATIFMFLRSVLKTIQ